jgi:hypothetical protein
MEWSVATVSEYSEMISLATRGGNVNEEWKSGPISERTHHVIVMKPDGTVRYVCPWVRRGKCALLQHDTYLHR